MSSDALSVYAPLATHAVPFWILVGGLFVLLPGLALLGHRLGARERRRRPPSEGHTGLPGETSLGALLALLGLLLGFTFSATLQWREARAAAIVEEAAAIGTAFLRADTLPDGAGRPLQEALLSYGRSRIVPPSFRLTRAGLDAFLAQSLTAQAALWPAMKVAFVPDVAPALQTHVSAGVTEVLDAHVRRAAAASKTVPPLTTALLIFVCGAGIFAVGNRSALQGRNLTWRTFLFSVVLACVLITIEDLDRPTDGFTIVRQDPLRAVVAEMEATLAQTIQPPARSRS